MRNYTRTRNCSNLHLVNYSECARCHCNLNGPAQQKRTLFFFDHALPHATILRAENTASGHALSDSSRPRPRRYKHFPETWKSVFGLNQIHGFTRIIVRIIVAFKREKAFFSLKRATIILTIILVKPCVWLRPNTFFLMYA